MMNFELRMLSQGVHLERFSKGVKKRCGLSIILLLVMGTLFSKSISFASDKPGIDELPFTYETDRNGDKPHPDTEPPSLLTDGRWNSAWDSSVQYNGDVSITADLDSPCLVERVKLMAYHGDTYKLGAITVYSSLDGIHWSEGIEIKNKYELQSSNRSPALEYQAEIKTKARYIKLWVQRSLGGSRVLLGEVIIEGTPSTKAISPEANLPVSRRSASLMIDPYWETPCRA